MPTISRSTNHISLLAIRDVGDNEHILENHNLFETLLEADALGQPVYWEREGEIRLIPNDVYKNAVRAASHAQALLNIGVRRGIATSDQGMILWEQCVPLRPDQPPVVTVRPTPDLDWPHSGTDFDDRP